MKQVWILVLVVHVCVASSNEPYVTSAASDVIHIATALDHLTVLEFGEAVTMAATGSPAFQIERHEDKVFIKPLKSGASTDLFVWTASRRFQYELEPPGEVKSMNFAVENVIPAPKPPSDSNAQMAEVADMILARAFLGAEHIDSSSIRDEKGHITIRIEQVFQSKTTLYIQYSILNRSALPYRLTSPTISEITTSNATMSVVSLRHKQLEEQVLRKLGQPSERPLLSVRSEQNKQDLQAGEKTRGVVVLRGQFSTPTILRLAFGSELSHNIEASVVL